MFNVTLSPDAKVTRKNLADQDKQDVDKWCEALKSWRLDKFSSRKTGIILGGRERVYMLKTDNDIRLVFKKDSKGIAITSIVPSNSVQRRTLDKARKTRGARVA
jgi:hypothetical protein